MAINNEQKTLICYWEEKKCQLFSTWDAWRLKLRDKKCISKEIKGGVHALALHEWFLHILFVLSPDRPIFITILIYPKKKKSLYYYFFFGFYNFSTKLWIPSLSQFVYKWIIFIYFGTKQTSSGLFNNSQKKKRVVCLIYNKVNGF